MAVHPNGPPPARPRGTRRLRVLTYNLLLGGLGREDLIAGVIERSGADVIALQEASDLRLVHRLGERLGMTATIGEPSDPASKLNVAVLSRLPVRSFENLQHHGMLRTHLVCELRLPSRALPTVRVHAVHLAARFGERGNGEVRRMRETRQILGDIAAMPAMPHVLLGDFNTVAPRDTVAATDFFSRMAELREAGVVVRDDAGFDTPIARPEAHDPDHDARWHSVGIHPRLDVGIPRLPWVVGPATRRLPRHQLLDRVLNLRIRRDTVTHLTGPAGYTDCYRALHDDEGRTCATWLPAARIDYVFADPGLAPRLVACEVVGSERHPDPDALAASDHLPVLAAFRY
jgi:endonuclease/exonuclease/phosphatase family metal-dependent hydrolase